jgi:hypothetical protein
VIFASDKHFELIYTEQKGFENTERRRGEMSSAVILIVHRTSFHGLSIVVVFFFCYSYHACSYN